MMYQKLFVAGLIITFFCSFVYLFRKGDSEIIVNVIMSWFGATVFTSIVGITTICAIMLGGFLFS